ncbi:MAG: riboflavin biosynthesis protein RibF [Candidatus Eremiobacteraeota bacterium]|nr:riboflavin biosynthesis protein RibF [Candidatus Eremiobacteraeota bacterium]
MKLYHELFRENERPLSLAIGFFDGMHRGHREIARAAFRMRKPGWRSGVLTFANHPAKHLRPGTEPPLLTTIDERIDLLGKTGFEECFLIPFDDSIASLSPEAFLEKLVDGLGVRAVAVGSTFRFGHKRAGDTALMLRYFDERGVALTAVENVMLDGERISSTRIRRLVQDGNLEPADHLLGHAYELRGRVELGFGRGHDLGFPTANLSVPEKLLPKDGVYAAVARYDGRDYAALVSIGTNPQFNGAGRTVEVWMRDFHETIYGHELAVRDLRYVREQRVFASVDELIVQMRTDLAAVAYPVYG